MIIKCLYCGDNRATSYYSPKELFKYNICLCNKCIKYIYKEDLRYIQNEEEIKKIIKRKKDKYETK